MKYVSEEQKLVRWILERKLLEAQAKNPSYSLRAMAKRLKINPAILSQVLRGKRRFSTERSRRILELICKSDC